MVRVTQHAIDTYIERILGKDPEKQNETVRELAERDIRNIAKNAPIKYRGESDMPPVHIGEGVALIYDYDKKKEDHFVPTVYRAETFEDKLKDVVHDRASA